jgi:hypothetical protein
MIKKWAETFGIFSIFPLGPLTAGVIAMDVAIGTAKVITYRVTKNEQKENT